jgi:myosin heavy subunit
MYGGEDDRKARQIYCIFILGHDIGIPGCPVIRVDPAVWDVATGKLLDASGNEFIDSMNHRSWIVQTRQLKYSRRTDLERLLSVFDPGQHHILSINEDDYPKDYRPIIRRLRKAVESEQIQVEMEYEDDYLEELQIRERELAREKKVNEEQKKAIEEKDKVIEEKDNALEEKDKVIEEKDNALEEKDKALEEKDNALEEQKKVIEELKKQLAGIRK